MARYTDWVPMSWRTINSASITQQSSYFLFIQIVFINQIFIEDKPFLGFSLHMKKTNAVIVLGLEAIDRSYPDLRRGLTRKILLEVCAHGGSLEMRKLFKIVDVTAVAARMRLKELEEAGIVLVSTDPSSKRCKMIQLTEHGLQIVSDYERKINELLADWVPLELGQERGSGSKVPVNSIKSSVDSLCG